MKPHRLRDAVEDRCAAQRLILRLLPIPGAGVEVYGVAQFADRTRKLTPLLGSARSRRRARDTTAAGLGATRPTELKVLESY